MGAEAARATKAKAARLAVDKELLEREALLIAQTSDEALAKLAVKRGWLASHAYQFIARGFREGALSHPPISDKRTLGLNIATTFEYATDADVLVWAMRLGFVKYYVFEALARTRILHAYYGMKLLLTPIAPPPKKKTRR